MPTKSRFHCKTCRGNGSKVRTKPMFLDYIFEGFAMRHVHLILSVQQYTDLPVDIFLHSGPHICRHRIRKCFGKSLVLRRCFRECLFGTYTYAYKELGTRYIYHNWSGRTGGQLSLSRDHSDWLVLSWQPWVTLKDKEDNNYTHNIRNFCTHSCGTQLDSWLLYIDTKVMTDQWDGMLKSGLTN